MNRFSTALHRPILFLALLTLIAGGFLAPFLVLCHSSDGRLTAGVLFALCEAGGCGSRAVPDGAPCGVLPAPDSDGCCDHVALNQPFTHSSGRSDAPVLPAAVAPGAGPAIEPASSDGHCAPDLAIVLDPLASTRSSILLI